MERLVSVREMASILGLRPSTLYKYVSRRKIPYKKIGERVLFDPTEIRVWIDQHSVKSSELKHRFAISGESE